MPKLLLPPFVFAMTSGLKTRPRFEFIAGFLALAIQAGLAAPVVYNGAWPPANTANTSAVPAYAIVTESPPSIQLKFPRPGAYQVARKGPYDTAFSAPIVTLPANSTTWTDTTVSVGQLYEYRAVVSDITNAGHGWANPSPVAYVLAGIKVDNTQPKGRMILVVTTDVQAALPAEVAQYQADLEAEGWFVHVIPVAKAPDYKNNAPGPVDANGYPTGVWPNAHILLRNQIIALYNQYPGEVKNLVLLGKVPACRSGGRNNSYVWDPDGHGVNLSCYGADGYYANMTGNWPDATSNGALMASTTAISVAGGTLNIPNDNKFDPYYMYETGGRADMGFGRIDLSNNIPAQYEAIRTYLNKLHRYKIASPDFQPGRRIAIRTGFPQTDETGWMCALNITAPSNVLTLKSTDLPASNIDGDAAFSAQNGPFLFYFKGNGGPTSGPGGKAVFWTGMQSHWGWWYSSTTNTGENTMAARLGEDSYTLSFTWNIFGLRYFYHRMGMGLDAGDMMRVSINNSSPKFGTYAWSTTDNSYGGAIAPCSGALFMNHFGDPALRLYMFPPATDLGVVKSGGSPLLNWTASTDTGVIGYHVYRQSSPASPFVRLTATPITATTFVDPTVTAGLYTYMVRAIRLEATGGGTFYNPSIGTVRSIDLTNGPSPMSTPAATLPDANWNVAYNTPLNAIGGSAPYHWTLVSGSLPPGLTLNLNGTITGSPTTDGVYPFTAKATDQLGTTSQQGYTITAQPNEALGLLPDATTYVQSIYPPGTAGSDLYLEALSGSTHYESYLRFKLASLNTHNSFVRAKLRIYALPGTTTTFGLLQASLTADAADAWSEAAMNYTTQPADNTAFRPILAPNPIATYQSVDIDVTPFFNETMAHDAAKVLSLHLGTQSNQAIVTGSRRSYGLSIPRLIIESTDAPQIVFNSPVSNPAMIYSGCSLSIGATTTAIPAHAATLTQQWTQISGPAAAVIGSPTQASTVVSFPGTGDYVLRLTATDGVLPTSKDLIVRVVDAPVNGPTSNLVLRLPFDETTGTVAHDVSGALPPNSGVFSDTVSGITWSPTLGRIQGALAFDGALAHRIDIPHAASLDGSAQMSISFWMYLNVKDATNSRAMICKRKSSGVNESYTVFTKNGTVYADFGRYVAATGNRVTSSTSLAAGLWYHIVATFDGTASVQQMKMYISGAPNQVQTLTAALPSVPANPLAPLRVGAFDNADARAFDGMLDEVRIYNRVLTPSEIQDLAAGAPSNVGPVVSLSSNHIEGEAGQPFNVGATITDDGAPSPLALAWTTVSGPGGILFADPAAPSTTGTASLSGAYAFGLTASDGDITTWAGLTANIATPVASYATWVTQYNLTGDNALINSSPAHDGTPNLLKYALGLDPTQNYNTGATGLPQTRVVNVAGDNYLGLSFNGVASDVVYTVEATSDLTGVWTTLYTYGPGSPGPVTVTDTVKTTDALQRFLRLRVTQP